MSANPSSHEFKVALKSIQSFRAPGPENIPLELIKHGRLPLKTRIVHLLLQIWERKKFHQIRRMQILSPPSRTEIEAFAETTVESPSCPSQGRSLPGSFCRLLTLSENNLPECRCGFGANRGTINMIFSSRQNPGKVQRAAKNPVNDFLRS